MGNDGGSIPKRRELVKAGAKEQSSSQIFEKNLLNAAFIWSTCRLSKEPLATPVVSDYLGRLYNKSAILEWLISPEQFGDGESTVPHIKSLKDVVELNISKDATSGKWVCPITGKELRSGGTKFICLSECGHVFAESALREIDTDVCLECNTAFKKENILIINPLLKADIDAMEARMERLRSEGLTNSLKPVSVKKKRKPAKDDVKDKKDVKKTKPSETIQDEEALRITKEVLSKVRENRKRSEALPDLYLKV